VTPDVSQSDLVVLVADADMSAAMNALVLRWQLRAQRSIAFESKRHPDRDHGCYLRPTEVLGPLFAQYRYALIVFDRHGCGGDASTRDELEREVERRVAAVGWDDRVAAIAIDPELEAWVWSDSPHVGNAIGWTEDTKALRAWLCGRGFWPEAMVKPPDPKGALREALRKVPLAASSALFKHLAERVSFNRCSDPSFLKLRAVLEKWFPPPASAAD
jgi:hypothetical protein